MLLFRRMFCCIAATAALLPVTANAQSAGGEVAMSARPLRLIVPASAGGPTDTWARIIAEKIQTRFGRSTVVDNRPGAGGVIGANALLQAPADGDTVYVTSASLLVIPAQLIKPKPFELSRFTPVGMLVRSTILALVHPSVPAATPAELVAYIKANPGKVVSSNAGVGSYGGLLVTQFADRSGIDIPQVPYKGGAPAMQAVLANEVQMFMGDMYQALPLVRAGKLRAIAQLGLARSDQLPDLPTLSESLPGFEGNLWIGVVARAGTPPAVVNSLNHALNTILAEDDIKARAQPPAPSSRRARPRPSARCWRTTSEPSAR